MKHTHSVLKGLFQLSCIHRSFGDAFASIGAREPQLKASLAFTAFGDAHRKIDQFAVALLRTVKPVNHPSDLICAPQLLHSNRR